MTMMERKCVVALVMVGVVLGLGGCIKNTKRTNDVGTAATEMSQIALEYVSEMTEYKDHEGASLRLVNESSLECEGCVLVEVEFELKLDHGEKRRATVNLKVEGNQVVRVLYSQQEMSI